MMRPAGTSSTRKSLITPPLFEFLLSNLENGPEIPPCVLFWARPLPNRGLRDRAGVVGGCIVGSNTSDIHGGKTDLKDDHGVCAIPCSPHDPQDVAQKKYPEAPVPFELSPG